MENDVVFLGDCFEYMQTLPDNSVDAVVTVPPYFIENLKIDMTSSNALKCVVSDYETTTNEVAPRKPFNIGDFAQMKLGVF